MLDKIYIGDKVKVNVGNSEEKIFYYGIVYAVEGNIIWCNWTDLDFTEWINNIIFDISLIEKCNNKIPPAYFWKNYSEKLELLYK